jgi:hypothetical protein
MRFFIFKGGRLIMENFLKQQSYYELLLVVFHVGILLISLVICLLKKFRKEGISKYWQSLMIYGYGLSVVTVACFVQRFAFEAIPNISLIFGITFIVDLILVKDGRLKKFGTAEVIYPGDLEEAAIEIDLMNKKVEYQVICTELTWYAMEIERTAGSVPFLKRQEIIENALEEYFNDQCYLVKCFELQTVGTAEIELLLRTHNICYNNCTATLLMQGTPVKVSAGAYLILITGTQHSMLVFLVTEAATVDIATVQQVGRIACSL